jgi:four helix bundle protein
MRNDRENVIIEKSFRFALKIIAFCDILEKSKKHVIARQLLRSGTSIGSNIREAQNAESKSDFIHKIKIAAKEADETEYWLLLCKHSESYPFDDLILADVNELIRIISKILSSSKS